MVTLTMDNLSSEHVVSVAVSNAVAGGRVESSAEAMMQIGAELPSFASKLAQAVAASPAQKFDTGVHAVAMPARNTSAIKTTAESSPLTVDQHLQSKPELPYAPGVQASRADAPSASAAVLARSSAPEVGAHLLPLVTPGALPATAAMEELQPNGSAADQHENIDQQGSEAITGAEKKGVSLVAAYTQVTKKLPTKSTLLEKLSPTSAQIPQVHDVTTIVVIEGSVNAAHLTAGSLQQIPAPAPITSNPEGNRSGNSDAGLQIPSVLPQTHAPLALLSAPSPLSDANEAVKAPHAEESGIQPVAQTAALPAPESLPRIGEHPGVNHETWSSGEAIASAFVSPAAPAIAGNVAATAPPDVGATSHVSHDLRTLVQYGTDEGSVAGFTAPTSAAVEIGVAHGTHGWLKVRAEMEDGLVKASLSSTTASGREMLQRELPAIHSFLQGEQLSLHVLSVKGAELFQQSNGTTGEGLPGQAPSAQQNFVPKRSDVKSMASRKQSESIAPDSQQGELPPTTFQSTSYGGWLSVRA